MSRYFEKFPNIYYRNSICKDLSRRISIDNNTDIQGNYDIFYPYELKSHLRPDHVSEYYYEDSELDWLVYLTNKVVDPYYEWYLNDQQFQSMLREKYESFENSIRLIKYYQNNWSNDDTSLTVSFYENNLEQKLKKYYKPDWGMGRKIISYSRKQDDSIVNTNRIVNYDIQYQSANTFIVGEPVDFKLVTSVIGQGQVCYANQTNILVQSVTGDIYSNSTYSVIINGTQSSSNCTSNNSSIVTQNISLDEEVYWSPVTCFDYEVNLNEQKKNINLIASGPHQQIVQQIANTLNENVDLLTNMSKEQ
jgi:hypothetical protein